MDCPLFPSIVPKVCPRQTHSTPFHPTPPKIEGDFDCLFTLADLALRATALREGVFNPEAMVSFLRAETNKALAEGYTALRLTGELTALQGLPGSARLWRNS